MNKRLLLIIVVRLDELVPRQSVAHEIGLVCLLDVRGLLEDRVVASEDRIVEVAHVRCAGGKEVGLSS